MFATLPPNFRSTEECLSTMFHLLKCENCSEVPKEDIWTPGGCNHKYCKFCIKKLARNECHVCKTKSIQKDRALDKFSTNLLLGLRSFVEQLEKEFELSESEPESSINTLKFKSTSKPGIEMEDKNHSLSAVEPGDDLCDVNSEIEDDIVTPVLDAGSTKARKGKGLATKALGKSTLGKKSTIKSKNIRPTKSKPASTPSTPEVLAILFADNDDSEKTEGSIKNGEPDKKEDKQDENDDLELDEDLPVLTPHPLTPIRKMALRASKLSTDGSRKSETPVPAESPIAERVKPTLEPQILLERVDSPSLDDDFKKPNSRKKKYSNSDTETSITDQRKRGTEKRMQLDPVEADKVRVQILEEFTLSDSEEEKTVKTTTRFTNKANSTSTPKRSKLKSQSPFGIKPVDSTPSRSDSSNILRKRKFLKAAMGSAKTTVDSKRKEEKTASKSYSFGTMPKTTRTRTGRSSLGSSFKAGKPKSSAIKSKPEIDTKSTTPSKKSVFDFHGTQSQSPMKPIKAIFSPTFDSDDKRSSNSITNTKRRRTTSVSSLGSVSSIASSEDLHSPLKPKTIPTKHAKRSKSGANSTSSNVSFQSNTSSIKHSPSISKKNARGETGLHIAARNGQLEKVKQLIEAGADVDAKDHAGWTPLFEAIFAKSLNFEIIKLLCTSGSGCDVNALGPDNQTPIHVASKLGLTEVVSYLLSQSAIPTIRDATGKLPRDLAKSDVIQEIFNDYEEKIKGQSQMSNDVSVELKISLQKAVLYFNYKPSKELLRNCSNILNINISNELTSNVTHVILDCKPKEKVELSREYLLSVLNGCWMLSSQWLEHSVDVKRFLDPRKYGIGGCHYDENIPSSTVESAIQRARVNREHGNPGLFHGMNFYLYKNTSWPSKDKGKPGKASIDKDKKKTTDSELVKSSLSVPSSSSCTLNKKDIGKLITFGSGKVINREPDPDMVDPLESPIRFHAASENANASSHKLVLTSHIVLYDDKNVPPNKYDMEHVKTLKIDWLIHSAIHFQLIHPDSYVELPETKETQGKK